tara:strand:- start:347 stop:1522 length:1176 start_codon:yes stop_codon:yes gene_type:complete
VTAKWQETTIKDIAVVDWGNTSLTKKAYTEGGQYLGVSAAGCDGRMSHAEHKKFTPVLSAIGAQCGRMFMPNEDFTAIKNTITLTPIEGRCDPFFLFYLLNFVELPQRGAGQPFISKGDIQKFPIKTPTLPEQKRIVEILDEAFAGIDQAIANTEKNLASARELFESYLNTILTKPEEEWIEGTLSSIGGEIKTGPFGSLLHKSDYIVGGTPLVNPAHINGGQITPDVNKTVNTEALQRLSSYLLQEGDIVIGRRGNMGRCAAVTKSEDGWLCGTGCFIIRPKKGNLAPFLSLLLSTNYYIDEITKIASGATMLNLSNKALGNLKISLPPPSEQEKLLNVISEIISDKENLNSIYQQKLTALNELKQSLLQKAFRGELTTDMAGQMQEDAA